MFTEPKLLALILMMGFISTSTAGENKPLDGKWEQRTTTYIYDNSGQTYTPLELPRRIACFTAGSFELFTPQGRKKDLEKDGLSCEVSEVSVDKTVTNWRLQCRSISNNLTSDIKMSVELQETNILSTSTTGGKDLNPKLIKSEMVMQRIGDCD